MKQQLNELKRMQQLAGLIKESQLREEEQLDPNENFVSPEAVRRDVMSYKPEELREWVMRYAESVSKGNWDNVENLRIALNIIKKEGIKL